MQRIEGFRRSADGATLFWRRWTPDAPRKGGVCIVHGLGEHCGRYDHVARLLADAGYATSAFDLRGFGRSQGPRGHLRLADALQDIDEALADERRLAADGAPLFLYGHSLGSLLALLYGLERRPALAGVIATGPALHTALRKQRVKVFMAQVFGALAPSLTMPSGLDDTKLTRNPEALAAYRADPLVHKRASLGFARDCFRAMDRVLAGASAFPLPLLLIHGGADEINLVSGSRAFAAAHPGDCTLKVYDGLLHGVEHEPEHPEIVRDIVSWLDLRVARNAPTAAEPGQVA